MIKRSITTHEYVLTKEEISMIMDICAMCVNRNIHTLGNRDGYYDEIKRKSTYLYSEILNKMGINKAVVPNDEIKDDPQIDKEKALYEFRSELLDKFIEACRGNDFNKLTLLTISDIIDGTYNKHIEKTEKEKEQIS